MSADCHFEYISILVLITTYPMYQVHEIHRRSKEEGVDARDVLIVAHSHFTRAVIARWLKAPLVLGMSLGRDFSLTVRVAEVNLFSGSHFIVEAAGVSSKPAASWAC